MNPVALLWNPYKNPLKTLVLGSFGPFGVAEQKPIWGNFELKSCQVKLKFWVPYEEGLGLELT